jgi:hypothetical protein
MFNLCAAGETTLFDKLFEVTELLLDLGHYVTIVTNCTLSEPLHKIITLSPQLTQRLFIKCSFPYLELKERGLIDTYFENIALLKTNGIAFSIELTANDETIPYIPEIKDVCYKYTGALCHIIESRNESTLEYHRLTKLPLHEHQASWDEFKSPLFEYQQKNWGVAQCGFCYAGEYRLSLDIQNGNVYQCCGMHKLAKVFENTEAPIHYAAVGSTCIYGHCYAAHYQSCLCGCIGEKDKPTYTEERNRTCTDGTTWLTPHMQEVFSNCISDFHQPYSQAKSGYINALMRKVYLDEEPNENTLKDITATIRENLLSCGCKKIALYGYGKVAKWLLKALPDTEITYVIDRMASELDSDYPMYSPTDNKLPYTDAIIVTPYADFSNIFTVLREKTNAKIISVLALADEQL